MRHDGTKTQFLQKGFKTYQELNLCIDTKQPILLDHQTILPPERLMDEKDCATIVHSTNNIVGHTRKR
jgi:hypothetical protein